MADDGWLTGWKAIAARIGLSIRTAKRYHFDFGMPVYRTPTGKPTALTEEVERWLVEFDKLRKKRKGAKRKSPLKNFRK